MLIAVAYPDVVRQGERRGRGSPKYRDYAARVAHHLKEYTPPRGGSDRELRGTARRPPRARCEHTAPAVRHRRSWGNSEHHQARRAARRGIGPGRRLHGRGHGRRRPGRHPGDRAPAGRRRGTGRQADAAARAADAVQYEG
ncbi:hypothetical protein LV779_23250 [Streptomyces thinghirensis]|nr:hypothetical protein [Streptomyces thinghirensis]